MAKFPTKQLQIAVIKQLSNPEITVKGIGLPVYAHADQDAPDHYILYSQPTMIIAQQTFDCQLFECTCLLDVITSFDDQNRVDSSIALDATEEILDRFLNQEITITDDWKISTTQLVMNNYVTDSEGETTDHHSYIRLRFKLYKSIPITVIPTPDPVNNKFTYILPFKLA